MSIASVDIIGAPGVGKTTLARAMIGSRLSRSRALVCSASDALLRPKHKLGFGSKTDPIPSALLRLKVVKAFLWKSPLEKDYSRALRGVAPSWKRFLDHCVLPAKHDDCDSVGQLLGMFWLLQALRTRALLEVTPDNGRIVLMDEPLSYRLSMFRKSDEGLSWAKRYYETMPLPAGLVVLGGDLDMIMHRLQLRHDRKGKIASRHISMNQKQIKEDTVWAQNIANLASSTLASRGVDVLHLPAENSLLHNVKSLDVFMDSVYEQVRRTDRTTGMTV